MLKRLLLVLCLAAPCASAQSSTPPATQKPKAAPAQNTPAQPKPPAIHQTVEVTATRLPEDPENVATGIEVFTGDELRMRGYRDLRSAMSLATGVEIAPGGDAGPAGSVPDFWGLKEFDAFLLLVDGVPWGGAFNPALTTLDLNDIERIEVLRGPAPVTFGATSFVGVIHVVHKDTASKERTLTLQGGMYGTGGFSFSTPVPMRGRWSSRLTVDAQREGFRDDRTSFRRGHGLWRIVRKGGDDNRLWLNTDINWLDQDPASPRPRTGATLDPNVPVDSNNNPDGSFLNDRRFSFSTGFDQRAAKGLWSSIISVSHSKQPSLRGFLVDVNPVPDNARGLRENIYLTDVYGDSHISWRLPHAVTLLVGQDYMHGTGRAFGVDFDYTVALNGVPAAVVALPGSLDVHIRDTRNFFGTYAAVEWQPLERLRLNAGIRLNATRERASNVDLGMGTSVSDSRTSTRAGASVGALFTAWQRNQDSLGFYVNYRDTFKPAAIDFGIETFNNRLILEPETSRNVEGGMKGRFLDRRMEFEASGFLMDFKNLVTSVEIGGLPALINAGSQRFQGFESEVAVFARPDLIARVTYSFHDARFRDFVQDFGGVPTQLAGKRLEMSARHKVAFGVTYSPDRGFLAGINLNYIGHRFMNMRNTAPASGFATVDLFAGFRISRWEIRVDALNLGDRRDPVAESEVGDAQYYLMNSRRVDAKFTLRF